MSQIKTKNVNAYVAKLNQFITMIHGHQLQGYDLRQSVLDAFMKNCKYPQTRNGLNNYASKALLQINVLTYDKKTGYMLNMDNVTQDNVNKAAHIILANNKNMNSRKKLATKTTKSQDVAQPQLFTESVMREQEQPIVTASDQLRHRIDTLEARLNSIINFFKTL